MLYDVSVPMALVDFIPVLLFAWAAVVLQRDLYHQMPKYAFACFAAGTIDVIAAGFLKALWKLLYAAGVCDFQVLNTMFLPVQSIGLLLSGLGVLLLFPGRSRRSKATALAVAPPVFGGTFVFIAMMVLGLGAMCGGLSALAVQLKKKSAVVWFVLCFLCSMGMGYLSSRDATSAAVNWVEQGVNCVGQAMMLLGALSLHRAGLRNMQ